MNMGSSKEKEDFQYVSSKIENEGFHYCFIDYSDFNDIEDERFHELREAYINATRNLQDYINSKL